MRCTTQRRLAWSAPVLFVVFFISFWPIAGFMPPPSPMATPEEVAHFFQTDTNWIRAGLIIGLFASCWLVPWASVITVQMKRIEGPHSPLAYAQLALSTLAPVLYIMPMMCWYVASYRPDTRSPELTYLLYDAGWLIFIGAIFAVPPWLICIAWAILKDNSADPVFPRWLAYLTLTSELITSLGGVCVFFKSGPLAWNGIIGFWCVFGAFIIWVMSMTYGLLRAIAHQERTEQAAIANGERVEQAAVASAS